MTANPLDVARQALHHDHDELQKKLDAVEKQALLLQLAQDSHPELVATLLTMTEELAAELFAHMAEEEGGLLNVNAQSLSPQLQESLTTIYFQHGALKASLEVLFSFLGAACGEEWLNCDQREAIYLRVCQLRYAFEVHSAEEEEFIWELIRLQVAR